MRDGVAMASRDWLVTALADYALMPLDDLADEVVAESRRRLVDSLGVAMGALNEPGSVAVRRYASSSATLDGSRIWGSEIKTTPELAALTNGTAVRYLDYNDAYFSVDSTHPSDMIAGLIAVAEAAGSTGRDLVEAIALGYEVAVATADGFGARARGWDHVNGTALGACCAAGRLMRLSREQLADAIGITVVSHVAMGQTRDGDLSMWKGIAAPDAVHHAVYACRMAEAGVHGPHQPFAGRRGFINVVLGGEMVSRAAFGRVEAKELPNRILDTHIKAWPVGIVAQAAADAALLIHERLPAQDEITSVEIDVFELAVEVMGSPEKWRPRTRETADHSMPFIVATALRDGRVDVASFADDKVRSETMHQFLGDRVRMAADAELTKGYPDGFPTRVTVQTRSGRTFVEEVSHPRGHARNQLSDSGLDEKFLAQATAPLGDEAATELLTALRAIDETHGVGKIGELVVADGILARHG